MAKKLTKEEMELWIKSIGLRLSKALYESNSEYLPPEFWTEDLVGMYLSELEAEVGMYVENGTIPSFLDVRRRQSRRPGAKIGAGLEITVSANELKALREKAGEWDRLVEERKLQNRRELLNPSRPRRKRMLEEQKSLDDDTLIKEQAEVRINSNLAKREADRAKRSAAAKKGAENRKKKTKVAQNKARNQKRR